MKKLSIIAILAVTFVIFSLGLAEAKVRLESRIMNICGKANVVTESISDNGARKVVNVVELGEVKIAAPGKKTAEKRVFTALTSKKSEGTERNLKTAVKEIPEVATNTASSLNTEKKSEDFGVSFGATKAKKFLAKRPTCGEFFGEGRELAAIDARVAGVSAPAAQKETLTASAPNTGATNIGRRTEATSQNEQREGPKQHRDRRIQREGYAVHVAPKQHGQNTKVSAPERGLIESQEKSYPAANGNGYWTVSRKKYILHEKNAEGKPIIRERVVDKKAWTNLDKGGDVKRGFAWVPGQIIPPAWMMEAGNKLTGIDPETGLIREMDIPVGYAINFDSRGNSASVVGKFSAVPKDRHLLEENTKGKEESHV